MIAFKANSRSKAKETDARAFAQVLSEQPALVQPETARIESDPMAADRW